ncbi:MAG: polymer-forming cytoskeletal protein [Bacteroidetes bacterium]|nr:polymer-forming cytoskeletal protein [Bacteroidota bacterium]
MFHSKKTEEANGLLRVMNQFGQGTVISGDVLTEGDIRIDGKVTGNVTSRGKTVVGASGVIEGNIICQNAHIDGRVNGTIEAIEILFLSKTAVVNGDIRIKKLVVEEGARFNGKCTMGMSIAHQDTDQTHVARPKMTSSAV